LKIDDIKRIAVIGSGTMGHGIAELALIAEYDVALYDINDEVVQAGYDKIVWSLEKIAQKGLLTKEQVQPAVDRLSPTSNLQIAVEDADVIIEAAPENLSLKHKLFKQFVDFAPAHAILATNTSSLPISEIASAIDNPERVVGMHFFNPPILMMLIEVIRGEKTSDEVLNLTVELARRLKKTPVVCRKDSRGFITSAIFDGFIGEAMWQLTRSEASIQSIDARMKYIEGFPMGPLELADLTGLDIGFNIRREAGLPNPPVLQEKIDEGKLGRKTGQGFYDYTDGSLPDFMPEHAEGFEPLPLYAMMTSIASRIIQDDVADPADIDLAMQLGGGFPKGPCAKADEIGMDVILAVLDDMKSTFNDPRYEAPVLLREMATNGLLFYT
jgi:enoyl-CoA hydratase/3-hydroxyacyl-CoA dehydrogenase